MTSRNFRPFPIVVLSFLLQFAFLACRYEAPAPPADGTHSPRISAEWAAWINRMPPGPASLHVSGTLHMPHPGFEATLVPKSPQGFNPAILMMDLHVEELDGMWPQVLTDLPVSYVEDPYDGRYTQVHIFYPDGDSVLLDLTEAM